MWVYIWCHISVVGQYGIQGVVFLVQCIVSEYVLDAVQWQWLLGRFYMLDKLLEEFPAHFMIRSSTDDLTHARDSVRNYDRVFSVLRFSKVAFGFSHTKASRMAKRIFYMTARLQAHNRSILKEIFDLLEDVETSIQVNIRRRLWRVAEEYDISQQAREEDEQLEDPGPPFSTPVISAVSTPRSGSPVSLSDGPTTLQPPPQLNVTNVMAANLVFLPTTVPPNSPNPRCGRKRTSNSTSSGATSVSQHDTDHESVSSGAGRELKEDSDTESQVMSAPGTPRKPERRRLDPNRTLTDTVESELQPPQTTRMTERRLNVEVADACVATSPSLRVRGLNLGVQAFESEPNSPQELSPRNSDVADPVVTITDLSPVIEDPHMEFAHEAAYDNTKGQSEVVGLPHPEGLEAPASTSYDHTEPTVIAVQQSPASAAPPAAPLLEQPCCSYDGSSQGDMAGAESGDTDIGTDGGLSTEEEICSSANATVNTSRGALLTEELSDLTLSPAREQERVSFREALAARSPEHSGGKD